MKAHAPGGGSGFARGKGMLARLCTFALPALIAIVAAALITLLAGCKSDHFAGPKDSVSYAPVPDRHPSLATDAPPLAAATDPGRGNVAPLAWYDYRNDGQLSTFSGYTGPTFESAVTFGYDRQYTSGGRVFDYYNQTTYRSSITVSGK